MPNLLVARTVKPLGLLDDKLSLSNSLTENATSAEWFSVFKGTFSVHWRTPLTLYIGDFTWHVPLFYCRRDVEASRGSFIFVEEGH